MKRTTLLLLFLLPSISHAVPSVAREWNVQCLAAIRKAVPAPTVHARTLYHSSAAMFDAWAAYDPAVVGVFHNEAATAMDLAAARNEAVSYAGYRILTSRFSGSVTLAALDGKMAELGYPVGVTTTTGTSPAAVGNRCAAAVLASAASDGSNQANNYAGNIGYAPVNAPLILQNSGAGSMVQPNRWQPLAFGVEETPGGQVPTMIQNFLTSHWGNVRPFVLGGDKAGTVYAEYDPGAPPYLGGVGDAEFKANNVEVIRLSAALDPASGETVDISPGATGNNLLGTDSGTGHALNPATGLPYASNPVNLADFGRVLAEFWADGPQSETPPGHWNVIANEVSDALGPAKMIFGTVPVLDELEWDVKLYLALNSAVHDAAIAAWGAKTQYDYVRPVSSIRYMGGIGQSSDPNLASYHPDGLPLETGLIELVTSATAAPGQRHEGLTPGKIAIRAWKGDPGSTSLVSGAGWMHAGDWRPYQGSTFVTPAFAGYVSGHSTFSRAAAEVLTGFTGSGFFPGGLGTHTAEPGTLHFEYGPSATVQLQWATYYDAADQAGLSRLYGGIHVAADDGPGRMIGSKVGIAALGKASAYMDGSILEDFTCTVDAGGTARVISWKSLPGYEYKAQWSDTLRDEDFQDLTPYQQYANGEGSATDDTAASTARFYRIARRLAP